MIETNGQPASSGILIQVIAFALFGVASAIGYYYNLKRKKALAALADAKGWDYSEAGDPSLGSVIPGTPFVSDGTVQESISLKVDGRECTLFDYQYTHGSGRNRHTYHFKVMLVHTGVTKEQIRLQGSDAFTEAIISHFGNAVKFEDIEFNKEFDVRCRDPKFAYDVITPETIAFIKSFKPANLVWDMDYLMYYHNGRWKPEDIEPLAGNLASLARLIPDYVVEASQARPDTGDAPEARPVETESKADDDKGQGFQPHEGFPHDPRPGHSL